MNFSSTCLPYPPRLQTLFCFDIRPRSCVGNDGISISEAFGGCGPCSPRQYLKISKGQARTSSIFFRRFDRVALAAPKSAARTMTNVEVIHAYRHLLRAGLRAVQFSKPARFTLRDQLRDSFRDPQAPPLEIDRVERTVEFLNAAASEKGLEHRIVKNLIRVEWERRDSGLPWYMMMRRLSRKPPK